MAKLQHPSALKHYKIKVGVKIYKVFHNDLKYAKLIRKKHTPHLPPFGNNPSRVIGDGNEDTEQFDGLITKPKDDKTVSVG